MNFKLGCITKIKTSLGNYKNMYLTFLSFICILFILNIMFKVKVSSKGRVSMPLELIVDHKIIKKNNN